MPTRALQFRFLVFELFLAFSATALAQDTATLTGTVRDNSGAVIPGSVVAIKHTATGTIRERTTNSAGEYVAAALVPGPVQPHRDGIGISDLPGTRRHPAGWQ